MLESNQVKTACKIQTKVKVTCCNQTKVKVTCYNQTKVKVNWKIYLFDQLSYGLLLLDSIPLCANFSNICSHMYFTGNPSPLGKNTNK